MVATARPRVAILREQGVTLISAGLDEVPMVYKNIREVMAAQQDLVTTLGQFDPKLVELVAKSPAIRRLLGPQLVSENQKIPSMQLPSRGVRRGEGSTVA